ncbi:protein of unknown function DUF1292 [Rippkaea orientalis PCC 8801]|uniref:DUF3727 domain-containing protein n=1 Tax=Rippkaea orientalis (strain PCC 8801 / RF-1) TaxID=41431 RepID=B7K1R0_RIPO1|nr:DUF3727 domain-containing protein [Rippkaea orientalis]ACK67602.1 protein of unknown function DUF1292 [Rippkaea orientalis PCC 8801]
MSSFQFSPENEPEEIDSVTLTDDEGRTLECYVENALEAEDGTYLLLMPVDIPVVILAWDDQAEEEEEDSNAILLEDKSEIEGIFPDAKAVLAELDLTLKFTAFTLTVQGELPPIEDDGILTLELDTDDKPLDSEELQFLASFYHQDQKYSIYTPLAPLLFLAKYNLLGEVSLVSPDDARMQPILEELLFDEME